MVIKILVSLLFKVELDHVAYVCVAGMVLLILYLRSHLTHLKELFPPNKTKISATPKSNFQEVEPSSPTLFTYGLRHPLFLWLYIVEAFFIPPMMCLYHCLGLLTSNGQYLMSMYNM